MNGIVGTLVCLLAGTRAFSPSAPLSHQRLTLAASPNNVVLEPSEEATAFDSFKVGSARIHRYSRQDDDDSGTEYVMWYHGRSSFFLQHLGTDMISRNTFRRWKKMNINHF